MPVKNNGKKSAQKYRSLIQLIFFVFVAAIAVFHAFREYGTVLVFGGKASLHAICPFGGVVSFWNLATLGRLVSKVQESSVALAGIGIFLAVLFGPVICGWVCPLGTFQEWIGKVGRVITGKKYNTILPERADFLLRYLRYIVLIWVSYMTVITGKLVFQKVDPYYALFNFLTGEVALSALVVLVAVTLLSLAVERPFCKYFCPYGAFLGIFNLFRFTAPRRNKATCISCGACNRACPMNIDIEHSGTVRNHQCISCLRCTSSAACPVQRTVEFSPAKALPAIGTPVVGLLVVLLLFGGIAVSALSGFWSVSAGEKSGRVRTNMTADRMDPADIRGSYTWSDIAADFRIPQNFFLYAFGAGSPGEKVKTLEIRYAATARDGMEIGTDSVRWFVALMTGKPFTPAKNTLLPPEAVSIIKKYAKAKPERISEAVSRTSRFFPGRENTETQ